MLTQLEVRNFKAWKRLEMPLARVTGIFGPNNAGKGSVMQLLLLLKQTKNAADRNLVLDFGGPDKLLDLGSYADAVHGRDITREMSWKLEWTLPQRLCIDDPTSPIAGAELAGDRLQTRCLVRALNGKRPENDLHARFMSYSFGDNEFFIESVGDSTDRYRLAAARGDFAFEESPATRRPLRRPVKTHLYPDEAKSCGGSASFLSLFEAKYEKLLDRVFYLGPLRALPKRTYAWSGYVPEHVGHSGEQTVDAILAATRNSEAHPVSDTSGRSFMQMIERWLDALGLAHGFRIEEVAPGAMLYRVKASKDAAGATVDLIDCGTGVSQLLSVLVLLHYVPEGSVVLLEQPELHLHPVAQSGLADVILSASTQRRVQVILESHSERLLRRLQRRVAEGSARADDVRLYHVETREGAARLADLKINQWGEIHHWPQDFFGDEMEEIASTAKASLRRKMEGEHDTRHERRKPCVAAEAVAVTVVGANPVPTA